jgi:hypothetical protein
MHFLGIIRPLSNSAKKPSEVKHTVKIGTPGYKVVKQFDPISGVSQICIGRSVSSFCETRSSVSTFYSCPANPIPRRSPEKSAVSSAVSRNIVGHAAAHSHHVCVRAKGGAAGQELSVRSVLFFFFFFLPLSLCIMSFFLCYLSACIYSFHFVFIHLS